MDDVAGADVARRRATSALSGGGALYTRPTLAPDGNPINFTTPDPRRASTAPALAPAPFSRAPPAYVQIPRAGTSKKFPLTHLRQK